MSTPVPSTSTASTSRASIRKVDAREAASITRLADPLNEMNWNVWRERIRRTLKVCGVLPYVDGIIECPDKNTHPDDFEI